MNDAKLKSEKGVQKQRWLEEVREGFEDPHWTIVPSQKKNK
jgi:hypothetical protein